MKKKVLKILILSLLIFSCSKEDDISNSCILTKIEFENQSYFFEFEYINNKLSKIKDFYFTNTLPEGCTYNVNYITNDSITIQGTNNSYLPKLSAKYNGNKLIKLQENTGGHYIYKFDYNQTRIRVLQVYINYYGNGGKTLENVAYADYFLDGNKNVKNVKTYKYNPINSNNATLISDIDYTYDIANNPLKNIIYPNFDFINDHLPHPSFFSKNNILSRKYNGSTLNYNFEYDENNNTIKGGYYGKEFYFFECF